MADTDRSDWRDRPTLLQHLIDQMESGNHVTDRAIRQAIGYEAWEGLKAEIGHMKPRPIPAHFASVLREYERLLKIADIRYRRAEYSRAPRQQRTWVGLNPKKSLHTRAEGAYEYALEYLDQEATFHPAIVTWLDRPVSPGNILDTIQYEPESVPRLITSRSQWANTLQQKKRLLVIKTLRYLLTGEIA